MMSRDKKRGGFGVVNSRLIKLEQKAICKFKTNATWRHSSTAPKCHKNFFSLSDESVHAVLMCLSRYDFEMLFLRSLGCTRLMTNSIFAPNGDNTKTCERKMEQVVVEDEWKGKVNNKLMQRIEMKVYYWVNFIHHLCHFAVWWSPWFFAM